MLRNILFQLLALISTIVTQPWRQARFHTVWFVYATASDGRKTSAQVIGASTV